MCLDDDKKYLFVLLFNLYRRNRESIAENKFSGNGTLCRLIINIDITTWYRRIIIQLAPHTNPIYAATLLYEMI